MDYLGKGKTKNHLSSRQLTMSKLNENNGQIVDEFGFDLHPHPPNSLDIASATTGIFLIPKRYYRETDSAQIRNYSLQLKRILRPKANCFTGIISKSY